MAKLKAPKLKGLFGFKRKDKKQKFTLHGEDLPNKIDPSQVTLISVKPGTSQAIVTWTVLKVDVTGNNTKLTITGEPVEVNGKAGKKRKGDVVGDLVGDMIVTVDFGASGGVQELSFTNVAYE